MAYNRENLLRKIIAIQNTVLEYKKKDVPQKTIFEKYIKVQYHISYSCFNDYLAVPAKAQLQKLIADREQQNNQLNLFEKENNHQTFGQ